MIYLDTLTSLLMGTMTFAKLIFIIGMVVLFALSAYCFSIAFAKNAKKHWQGIYFLLFSACLCAWAVCYFIIAFAQKESAILLCDTVCYIAGSLFPGLLYLHIWKQVSYKNISSLQITLVFCLPFIFIIIAIARMYSPMAAEENVFLRAENVFALIRDIYSIVMLVLCYLLCFSVLYQMPRHMRKSTHYMLVGVSSFMIYLLLRTALSETFETVPLGLTFGDDMLLIVVPVTLGITLGTMFRAFSVSPADNVIATSRQFVLNNLSTIILVLSKQMRILDWNTRFREVPVPMPVPEYQEPFDDFRQRLIDDYNGYVSAQGDNIITIFHEGKELHYLLTTHEIRHGSKCFGYLVEISEVTQLFSALRTLEDSALTDQLTGFYNRNAYIAKVQELTQEEHLPLLVIVGDVNNLKQVNDNLGHLAGDALLINISQIIKQHLPENAFAARIGGDEFVVLVPAGNMEQSSAFMENVNQSCKRQSRDMNGEMSISWGAAVMSSINEQYNDVFAKADKIMYRYKKERAKFRSSGFVPSEAQMAKLREIADENQKAADGEMWFAEIKSATSPLEKLEKTGSIPIVGSGRVTAKPVETLGDAGKMMPVGSRLARRKKKQ